MVGTIRSRGGPALESEWQQRGRRRARILPPALEEVAAGDDPSCRTAGLKDLGTIAETHGTAGDRGDALRWMLAGTRGDDPSVRVAAIGGLAGLATSDLPATLTTLGAGLDDPVAAVRLASIREWGVLGVLVPEAQPQAAAALTNILTNPHEPPLRQAAVWGLSYFGTDSRRHPRESGPDVTPALVVALSDPNIELRRTAEAVLYHMTINARLQPISAWWDRRDRLIPHLLAALGNADALVQRDAALALFSVGRRDTVPRPLLEEAGDDPRPTRHDAFVAAFTT